MKKYKLMIIGYSDDGNRTEYVADESTYDTREEALEEKRRVLGPEGAWSESDVYATIKEIKVTPTDVDVVMMIDREMRDNLEKTCLKALTDRIYSICKEDDGVHDRSFIESQVYGDYIIYCSVRGIVPKSGYAED